MNVRAVIPLKRTLARVYVEMAGYTWEKLAMMEILFLETAAIASAKLKVDGHALEVQRPSLQYVLKNVAMA